jgi:hypothetical protein
MFWTFAFLLVYGVSREKERQEREEHLVNPMKP